MIKDAGSFGDSTLTRFFPLIEEDKTLMKVLEIEAEVIEYLRSTYKLDWDPAKPFGAKPNTATKEAERFAKQVESTSALLAHLSIYLQRTQTRKNAQPCLQGCLLHLCLSAWWMKHWLAPCLWQIT